jgi:hypothetical protein
VQLSVSRIDGLRTGNGSSLKAMTVNQARRQARLSYEGDDS